MGPKRTAGPLRANDLGWQPLISFCPQVSLGVPRGRPRAGASLRGPPRHACGPLHTTHSQPHRAVPRHADPLHPPPPRCPSASVTIALTLPFSLPPPDLSHPSQCSSIPPLITTYTLTMVAFVHTPVPLRASLTKYVARRRR